MTAEAVAWSLGIRKYKQGSYHEQKGVAGSLTLPFLNTFSQVFETLDFFNLKKKKQRNIIYTRFDCFHAVALYPTVVSMRTWMSFLAAWNYSALTTWL